MFVDRYGMGFAKKNADGEFKSSCSVPRLPPERFPNLAQTKKRRLKIFRRRFYD
jgi:hypothetical protein